MERERIPSLDGARAISISLVIASHAMWKGAAPHILGFDYGNLGVRIFFVISGFIITRLLIQERERIGRISIAQFYLRRAFRILPAAYVCIAVMAGLLAITTHMDGIAVRCRPVDYSASARSARTRSMRRSGMSHRSATRA